MREAPSRLVGRAEGEKAMRSRPWEPDVATKTRALVSFLFIKEESHATRHATPPHLHSQRSPMISCSCVHSQPIKCFIQSPCRPCLRHEQRDNPSDERAQLANSRQTTKHSSV